MPRLFQFYPRRRIAEVPAVLPYSNTKSILFGGTDEYITGIAGSNLGITTKMSLSCWVRWTASPGASDAIVCLSSTNSQNDGFGLDFVSSTQYRFWVNHWSNNRAIATVANTQVWHHVVGVYDGSLGAANVKVYADAVVGATTDVLTASVTGLSTNSLSIGRKATTGTPAAAYATGYIDEVAIWDVALSASEITTLYNGGTPGDLSEGPQAANLKVWYRMGDGDAFPTVSDHAGGGYDGTMINMESGDISTEIP